MIHRLYQGHDHGSQPLTLPGLTNPAPGRCLLVIGSASKSPRTAHYRRRKKAQNNKELRNNDNRYCLIYLIPCPHIHLLFQVTCFRCTKLADRLLNCRSLRPNLVFDPFYVNTTDENLAVEHNRDASLIRGDPHRAFVQPFRVTVLHNVFDPRYDLESIDPTGGDSDDFSTLDFQIQEIAISSSEDIEIKMIANFKILAPGEVN